MHPIVTVSSVFKEKNKHVLLATVFVHLVLPIIYFVQETTMIFIVSGKFILWFYRKIQE